MGDTRAFGPDIVGVSALDFQLDFSALTVRADQAPATAIERALRDMAALEAGAIVNPDENRRVGHYWLRAPDLAPESALRDAIVATRERVKQFGAKVRSGELTAPGGAPFEHLLHLGIGGSALGPQFVADALGGPDDPLTIHFLDNTDPDGFERVFARLGDNLARTLVIVVSKSGGTPETRNALEEVRERFVASGLKPAGRFVAVTREGSALHQRAQSESWLETFPMWDWVGGRTSQTSAVGLAPMSVLGHDVDAFLAGARAMDEATRSADAETNPALRLALAWWIAAEGAARRAMVVLPYRDRLALFSRYLQQLVMESLGKEQDLAGRTVHQGLTVFGNKGSTDQHAFVQQLRDGPDDFFATFVVALDDGFPSNIDVEPGVTSGDFLLGFFLGTRRALIESGRKVISITVPKVDARSVGGLIALYERAVGFYASFAGINAYHQPGVEAGKKAAARVLDLQRRLLEALHAERGVGRTAAEWAARAGAAELSAEAWWVLAHLAANPRGVRRVRGATAGGDVFSVT